MDEKCKTYLNDFLDTLNPNVRTTYTSFSSEHFCGDKKNANICSDLIKRGIKTAGCSMKYWYEQGGEKMPQVRHLTVVTDWDGNPTSIIEIISVAESRYLDVTEEFAHAEGEGDRTLEWWRKAHWDFFSQECREEGITLSSDVLLILERFKVVYP